ncbi:MAG: hypothetical protein KJO40_08240 [Deltaproteobacteria bacterium]|nr:hypothetical protein [Deltaproteobacteria bacterium]NND29865.1 hypothetical protein [Myxococcales bacterium]MBT8466333.1 hypothetical protein [Deltaproteobacteria bacterium]MBT8480269.1 hypothetical protein [Deltaproteobacteria bacterium]NNK07029.1 hypothetical protein [Myxococcales bacterium]
MRHFSSLNALAFVGLLGSCNSTDLPTAPNLQPVLDAYANPTAMVDGAIMGEVAQEIADNAEAIEDSEIFEEILDVITDVQQELENATPRTCTGGTNNGNACSDDADCPPEGSCDSTGDVVLGAVCTGGINDGGECANDADCPDGGTCGGGVFVPTPTGAVQINYICPGWDQRQFDDGYEAEPDAATNGSIDLFMTIDSGGIGRVVWGTAARCLYLLPIEGSDCESAGCSEASYDGGVALDLGDDWVSEDIAELLVTFLIQGTIGFDGDDFRINQSFRVTLDEVSGLTLLVDVGDPALEETFNFIFAETFQCVRDATPPPDDQSPCSFGCSLEERRCFDESGTLFSW